MRTTSSSADCSRNAASVPPPRRGDWSRRCGSPAKCRRVATRDSAHLLDRFHSLPYCGPSSTTDPSMPVARSSAFLLILLAVGCGGHKILVPPRLDLKPYGKVGLVTFTVENATGSLQQFATERFSEEILAAQPGVEVLELGPLDGELDAARAQQLGKDKGVAAVFAGHLKVTNPTPGGGISSRSEERRVGKECRSRWSPYH